MNKVPCSCEDFLLDTKLADPVPNLEHGPCGGSSFGNLGLESPSSSFNGRDSGVKYTYNQNPSLHDDMYGRRFCSQKGNHYSELNPTPKQDM
ncbi:hypothetical protein PVL29_016417 [Vitis rotundifolia]|uniref:Uncharacterized protein n=1 Tax=Vitis rotundifolia TaxID=103349 RepID=A0AA39DGC4_VITRO|nr:hypothetical protein PVL29_016417 [Vitis rotundifolia]